MDIGIVISAAPLVVSALIRHFMDVRAMTLFGLSTSFATLAVGATFPNFPEA